MYRVRPIGHGLTVSAIKAFLGNSQDQMPVSVPMLAFVASLALVSSGDIQWATSLKAAKDQSLQTGRLILAEFSSPT